MKKYILLLVLMFSLTTPASAFAGGDGSADDPYQISNVDELQAINNDLDAHYVLINDIDASETINWNDGAGFVRNEMFVDYENPFGYGDGFEPIGDYENPFNGVFDGQNYKITGLYVSFGELFDTIGPSALIKNIRLINVHIWNGSSALAGNNLGTIDNAYVTGGVGWDTSGYNAAGFVHFNDGTISNSYANVGVINEDYAAGFVYGNDGTISNSYATGEVSGYGGSGGFVRSNWGTISNSYSTAYVEQRGYDEDDFFAFSSGDVTNSYWNTDITTLPGPAGEGRTTDEMTYPYADNTYVGWDFENVWAIDENVNVGYPYLQAMSDMFSPPTVAITSITVTGAGSATTVENGKTLQMTATVYPADATNKDVTWSVVAGTGTATISQTGLLTGTKAGTVTVKAAAKDGSGVQGSLVITVTKIPPTVIPVTGVELSAAATKVEVGKTLQMTATVLPSSATNKDVIWSVENNTGAAVILKCGLLTGKAAGTVTVRVTSSANSSVQDAFNITVTAAKPVSTNKGGGGGGGDGGSTGEKIQNIALKDVVSLFVGKGSVRFDFKNADDEIRYIQYTSLKNSGTITAIVEVLKAKSGFADSSPEGVIYKHVNIWLGKTGYATEANIQGAAVGFRVDRNWIEDKGIDPASIALNRYSDNRWKKLSTQQTKSDENYYYYHAQTSGFSSFAITGEKLQDEKAVHSTHDDEINEHVSFADLNGTEVQAEKNVPGLSFAATLLIVSLVCFLKRKQ